MTDLEYKALKIRAAETVVKEAFHAGEIRGTVHLSMGQEFIDVGIINGFGDALYFGNHRSHGQYLAATDDFVGLFRQISSNMTQHLYFEDRFMSGGIQGALLPVAFGNALAYQLKNDERRVVAFVGDGTFGQGILYETLSFMGQYGVNMTIVAIDNGYSMSATDFAPEYQQLAAAFNLGYTSIPYCQSYGDPDRTRPETYSSVAKRVRGPHLIHCDTIRLCGHSCNDTEMYRPKVERADEYRRQHDIIDSQSPELAELIIEVKQIYEKARFVQKQD